MTIFRKKEWTLCTKINQEQQVSLLSSAPWNKWNIEHFLLNNFIPGVYNTNIWRQALDFVVIIEKFLVLSTGAVHY